MCVVPAIWFLEIHELQNRIANYDAFHNRTSHARQQLMASRNDTSENDQATVFSLGVNMQNSKLSILFATDAM